MICAHCTATIDFRTNGTKTFYYGKLIDVCPDCLFKIKLEGIERVAPLSLIKKQEVISAATAFILAFLLSFLRGMGIVVFCLRAAVVIDIYHWIQRIWFTVSANRIKEKYKKNKSYYSMYTQYLISKFPSEEAYYDSFEEVSHLWDQLHLEEYHVELSKFRSFTMRFMIHLKYFLHQFKFISLSFYVTLIVLSMIVLFYTVLNAGFRIIEHFII